MSFILMSLMGIALIIGTVISIIYSVVKTPDHLRGFYGAFYAMVSLTGFIGGIALIVFSFLS